MIIALRTLAAAIVAVTLSLAFGEPDAAGQATAHALPTCQTIPGN